MAEIKNSFLRSKMNKDLDDRLIPNGEYRDAQNISVGKSEADDIGALETVLGNSLIGVTNLSVSELSIIGYYSNETNDNIFVFLTDYTDPWPVDKESPNPTPAPTSANCFIYELNLAVTPNVYTPLVVGSFLNFSKNSFITGVSLIEDLLFFTDNRNQPRKINVKTANPNNTVNPLYYSQETDISVAKYNPFEPVSLLNKVIKQTTTGTGATTTLAIANTSGIKVGMLVVDYTNNNLKPDDFIYVTTITANTSVTLNASVTISTTPGDIYFLSTTMTGENITLNFNDGNEWPGDPDYLESKFIRLSYRFQYDDGEYSIIAPFTQVAFIPKQKGYFLGSGESSVGAADQTPLDEDNAYRSTILQFMENGVQDIKLLIPLPDKGANIGTQAADSYKIQSIDVLYKESDGLAIKVLDTIRETDSTNSWTSLTTSVYEYDYQSRKPFKTLPTDQTTRVYDKVPVRALAQETAGNRIIYGNFLDKYTPPSLLNYRVAVGPKILLENFDNWVEYPSHSVKQDRNYQVGFVLCDKYGRQSDVILSNVEDSVQQVGTTTYGGSTIYNPFNTAQNNIDTPVKQWLGDSLKVKIDSVISSSISESEGTPGIYASNVGLGFNTFGVTPVINNTNFTYTFTINANGPSVVPIAGSYLRGEYKDYVKINSVTGTNPYIVTCDGAINIDIYSQVNPSTPDTKFSYTLNEKGWYSYKIVVKQQEQDYYNVFLPGIVNGYFGHTQYFGEEINETGFSTLFGDNINKIPRDLSEVGPEQKQYRSSVKLSGRVQNVALSTATFTSNKPYYPFVSTATVIPTKHSVDAIGPEDVIVGNDQSTTTHASIYQGNTNPYLVRISTKDQSIGLIDPSNSGSVNFPVLAIYETDPQESLLDIFWETPSVGLISDLNTSILTNFTGAVDFSTYNWTQPESLAPGSAFIQNVFPIDNNGNNLTSTTITNFRVVDDTGATITSKFNYINNGNSGYNFITNATDGKFVYNETINVRRFTIFVVVDNAGVPSTELSLSGNLSNVVPVIDALSTINTNTSVTGTLATLTGENGSSDTVNDTDGLKWSITAGNTLNSFSIDASSGVLSKNSASSPSGTFNLTIKLQDANGNVTNGSLFAEATQTIEVASLEIGAYLNASPPGVQSESCNINGALNLNCGTVLYYNNGSVSNPNPTQNVVVVDDVIRTGPNGTNSPVAAAGYYSYICNQTGLGNRRFFRIFNSNGIVNSVDVC